MGTVNLVLAVAKVLRVDLDLEVSGDQATIDFHQDVFLGGYEQFLRKGIEVQAGERWRLSYEIEVPHDASQLVVQLYATTVSGDVAAIQFHEARLSMTSGPVTAPRVTLIQGEVSSAATR